MTLNIKNERTVALVRELAQATGQTQTSAIETAVAAELKRLGDAGNARDRRLRLQRARVVVAEIGELLTERERDEIRRSAQAMYDSRGLPA